MGKLASYSLSQISKIQWLIIFSVFVCVIVLHIYVDTQLGYSALGGDQFLESIFALKQMNTALYPLDPMFSNASNFEMYTPSFLGLLKFGFTHLDLASTFRAMQPFLAFTYLSCMFLLLYKLTGRIWLSIVMTLISAPVVPTYPTENWGGALSIRYAIPRTFFLAVLPLVYYYWLRFQEEPKKLWLVYLSIGLLTHIHPATGAVLTAAFLLAQLFQNKFSLSSIKQAILCAFAASIPVIPFAIHYFGHTQEGYHLPPEQFNLFLKAIFYRVLFIDPHFIISYLPHALLQVAGWIGLGIFAYVKLKKAIHPALTMFILSCVSIFVLYFAFTYLVLAPLHILPTLVDITRVTKLIFLPVLIIVTLWLAQYRGMDLIKRITLVFLLGSVLNFDSIAAEIQSGKLIRIPEYQVKQYLERSDFVITKEKLKHKTAIEQQTEMALWIKEHLPSEHALIHVGVLSNNTTNVVFLRAISQRSFLPSRKDGGMFFFTNKPLYLQWYLDSLKLNAMRERYGYCSVAEQNYAKSLGANYLICAKSDKPNRRAHIEGLPILHENKLLWLFSL